MRKIFQLLVPCFFIFSCSSQKQFIIKAKIEGAGNEPFVLEYREVGEYATIDTVSSVDGKFRLKGSIEKPAWVHLISKNTGRRLQFYLENSKIKINGTLDALEDATIKGSKTQDDFISFVASGEELKTQYSEVNNEYLQALEMHDLPKILDIEKEGKHILDKQKNLLKKFISENPNSYAAPALIRSFMANLSLEELESLVAVLDTGVASYPLLKPVYERIKVLESVAIGQKAPDVSAKDIYGNTISLSSRIGSKVLMIYFWASWNPRSIMEFQNLLTLHNQYNKKGFDIFGISLDYQDSAWKKAIADYNLPWINISDLAYTVSYPAIKYGVASLPSSFLLDENGVIIDKDIWGDELRMMLDEYFDQQKGH